MKIISSSIYQGLALFVFAYVMLLSPMQAVVPPPDGGYPNFTTAEGDNALKALTAGVGNTAMGTFSLFSVSTGNLNTAVGAGSLDLNEADFNTATGAAALLFNTAGSQNTATGTAALELNSTGSNNTAAGAFALFNNAGANDNTAIGVAALIDNTTGSFNTATGSEALFSNLTGEFNAAFGAGALDLNTVGNSNTAIGASALQADTEGDDNTAVGANALDQNTTGNRNTVVGRAAGHNIVTANNVICIGDGLDAEDVSDTCYINNIFNSTSFNGIGVLVNGNGKLGTTTSSRRFKDDIKPMNQVSEALFALKPVRFHYKKEIDPAGTPQLGLVAEDVEKVNPDLVVRDKEGKPYSVRYDQVNAMLLNEFLKEHRAFLEEQGKVERLEKQVAVLTAGLQKVSAQLAASSPSLADSR